MAKPTNYKGIHITVTYAMGYDYYEIRQINKGKKWNEKILFSTLKEAKMYIDEHYDELIKNESKKSVKKSSYFDLVKAKEEGYDDYKHRNVGNPYKKGTDLYDAYWFGVEKAENESSGKTHTTFSDEEFDSIFGGKMCKKSIRESYDYDDIKDETPIIDVWGNSEGTHVYEVFKINSDYVYYEYNYRKHDSTMIVDNNEIEVIIRLMDYLPTKFIVKQEDKIGMLESAIANIKAIDKHYGKLKKYNRNYYWQAVRFIKNSMLKDDDPDASNYFDEADDVINDALEQNGDSFRV